MIKPYEVVITAISIALVALATLAVNVYIPATRGYFNVGEVMVYTIALLFGPKIGAIAGGLGSSLADILTGYLIYAPATLVIKGLEGLVVGYVSRLRVEVSPSRAKLIGLCVALALGLALWLVGSKVYVGTAEVSLGWASLSVNLTCAIWAILASLMAFVVACYLWRAKPENLSAILSIILGGPIMVLGYYLYEQLVLGLFALAEVPANIGQMLIGLLIAIPLYATLKPKVMKLIKV
ncbi:MAG: hypothetical protein B6U69_04230 [Thermofilum sp. ex4484_15]|nr:MAG: hypothetical protein B6U69_04230 [Thermofilum sp. ex4484_15]